MAQNTENLNMDRWPGEKVYAYGVHQYEASAWDANQ
jgi:hypothetical protein